MKKIFKRGLAVLLAIVMVVGAAPLAGVVGLELPNIANFFNIKAEATSYSGTCGADLTWTLDTETGVLEISGTGKMTDWKSNSLSPWRRYDEHVKNIIISSKVTSIGDYAFNDLWGLASVTIPNNVMSIGKYAFSGCTGLISITIPNSVTSIGKYAFYECTKITSITIGSGVTSMTNSALFSCIKLTNITVDPANTSFSSDEYGVLFDKDKTKLILYPRGNTRTNYIIPDSVMSIGDYAFGGCTGLTSITIPNSVTSIGSETFRNCTGLTSIIIGNSVAGIGSEAFQGCIGLSSVTIPNSVTSIGSETFRNCTGLTSIIIGNSVAGIGSGAFQGCIGLSSVTIPNNVTSIGDYAFSGCAGLSSITIGDSVSSIGVGAFNGTAYYNDNFNWENGALYIDNYLIAADKSILKEYEIKSGTKTIAECVFNNCNSLISIVIPEGITNILDNTFSYSSNLISITIPNSVTRIGIYAFDGCTNLADVYYTGTEDEWNAITIGGNNECLTNSTIHFNYVPEGGENETPDKLELVSTYPVNNATSVSYDDELVMTFNQNLSNRLFILDSVSAIKICDYNTDKEIYRIDIDDYGAIGFDDSPIVIEGNRLTIRNALHKLVPGSKYYVSISPNIIIAEDYTVGSDKGFAGITDKDTWTFSYLSPSIKERYSLDVYFNEPTVSLSAGESASVSAVLSFNGATTFPEMSFSIDDSNIAEITEIKTESNITYAKIRGNNQGSATITITANTVDGNIVKKFPVFVSDPETVYYCNYIDGRFDKYDPFYVSGMYIDNFKHTENDDGSVTADFDVYNGNHSIGVVEIYDENGTLKDVETIDMFDSDYPSDIFSHAGYAYKLVEGMATGELFDSELYTSGIWHQKTHISVTIPQNGYYLITNNISVSDYCLIYNVTLLAVESAFKLTDSITDATAVSKEISKTISNAIPTIGDAAFDALKKLAKSIIKGWSEDLAETSVGVEKVFDDFYDFLTACGLDFAKLLVDSVKKVAPEAATSLVIDKLYGVTLDKCGTKIVDNIFYKPVEIAKWGAVFTSICENSSSRSVYIYNQQNNSMKKSNGIVSYSTESNDTVFHTVILKSGDKVDYINTLTGEQEKAKVYDISLIRDGESVQPKDSVTVYIPIPNGWNTNNLTLYHISKETGKREKIPVEIENGYAKFVTDSFSYFILGTDELKFVDTFGIKTPSTTTISYGDTLILHAVVESVQSGTNIVWDVSGNGVSIKPSEDGLSCAVTSTKTGTVSISAKLVDESGEVLKNFVGEELTASQSIKSNAGFFQKIIAFFKKLFGLTKTIPQVFKGLI